MPRNSSAVTPVGKRKLPLQPTSANVPHQPRSGKKSYLSDSDDSNNGQLARRGTVSTQPPVDLGMRTTKRKSVGTNEKPTKRARSTADTQSPDAVMDKFIIQDGEMDGSSDSYEPPTSSATSSLREIENASSPIVQPTRRASAVRSAMNVSQANPARPVGTPHRINHARPVSLPRRANIALPVVTVESLKQRVIEKFRRKCGYCSSSDFPLESCADCKKAVRKVKEADDIEVLQAMLEIAARLGYAQLEVHLNEKRKEKPQPQACWTPETYKAVLEMLKSRFGSNMDG